MSISENFISFRVDRHPNDVRSYFLVDLVVKNFEFFLLLSAFEGCFFSSVLSIYAHEDFCVCERYLVLAAQYQELQT